MKERLIAVLVFAFYSLLRLTWRIRIHEPEDFKRALAAGEPMVFAHWHGDELGIVFLLKRYRSAAMVSTSKDGEIMANVVRLMGARTSRGSSTRGGASALKGILRLSREGWRPSIAVDGPKGPLHKVKPGVFEISKLTGGTIYPLTAACDRGFVFKKAWNKAYLPLPFARLQIVWGAGLPAVPRSADSRDSQLALDLERALADASRHAANLIATS